MKLYHGTLARNLPHISEKGLTPQKGSWADITTSTTRSNPMASYR
jgi:RNA:NAD 2'-phosphotransferase (TPT1/KptA family)